ncbi:hypothetical protein Hypma_011167 [Hypsizygus marmoreus]|uniref:Uncharacterized protein n=1 Tax=Hypsizygus marmoreus TaxID=39966 RepID=A0A369JIR1_HYPMA|nr:hypothetical protein Hypma_011167 [Hypsizygus marmoreus]
MILPILLNNPTSSDCILNARKTTVDEQTTPDSANHPQECNLQHHPLVPYRLCTMEENCDRHASADVEVILSIVNALSQMELSAFLHTVHFRPPMLDYYALIGIDSIFPFLQGIQKDDYPQR